MTPAMASGDVAAVGDEQVLRVQAALDVVEGAQPLPWLGSPHDDRAAERVQVERMQRLAQLEHDVVGHVDGQGDGPHAGLGQPPAHPGGRRCGGVDAAHDSSEVAVATRGALQRRVIGEVHGIPLVVGRGYAGDVGGVAVAAVGAVLGMPVLAGDPTHREAVATVWGHLELDDLVVQAEQGDRIVTWGEGSGGFRAEVLGEPDDPGVVRAEAKLVLGADHAVGDLAVGLPRADGQAPGQDGTGQDDDDEVTGVEVRRAAHDLLRDALREPLPLLAHVDGAVPDRLAVLLDPLLE